MLVRGMFIRATTFGEWQLVQDKKLLPASLQLQVPLEQRLQSSRRAPGLSKTTSTTAFSWQGQKLLGLSTAKEVCDATAGNTDG